MDGTVTIQDESVLCGTCKHCGTGLENECHASPDSKVLDCPDYERKLSEYFKEQDPNIHKLVGDMNDCGDACEIDFGKKDDKVNHPSHYTQGGIECIQGIEASMSPDGFQDYCKGNVLKYIWRWRDKGGIEDLRKASVYLNWLIESAENGKILYN